MFGKKKLPEKLNICIVARRFPMLGRATEYGFLWPIAKNLAVNHTVSVIAYSNPDNKIEIAQDNVKAHFLFDKGQSHHFSELAYEKFSELHRHKPFDIVHSIDDSGIEIAKNKKNHKVAVAFDVEATNMSTILSLIGMTNTNIISILKTSLQVGYLFLKTYFRRDRELLSYANGIFVSSPLQMESLEKFYLYPSRKIFSVPYGIDVTDLSPREKSGELQKKLNLPKHSKIAVSHIDTSEIGVAKKIIASFEKVAIKKPSSRLVLIGKSPMSFELEKIIYEHALGSKVIYVENPSPQEYPEYIGLADVFIGLSNKISTFLEAMAQKKMVITSRLSPLSTFITDGQDGFLVHSAEPPLISQLILKIFNNKIDQESIGEEANKKILNLFDMKKMVTQTVDAYHNILVFNGEYKK